MAVRRNRANFEFALHLDENKGANRVTFEPGKATKFFKSMLKNNPNSTTHVARVKHLNSNLVWETDDLVELEYFISTFVDTVGVLKHG